MPSSLPFTMPAIFSLLMAALFAAGCTSHNSPAGNEPENGKGFELSFDCLILSLSVFDRVRLLNVNSLVFRQMVRFSVRADWRSLQAAMSF